MSTFSGGSQVTKVMGAIDQKVSTVLLGDFLVVDKVRGICIHREEALGDDQNSIVRVSLSGFFQHFLHFILIEMLKPFDLLCCREGSFLQTVVRNMVHDDVVCGSDKGVDDSKASHPPSGEDEHVKAPVFFKFLIQLN